VSTSYFVDANGPGVVYFVTTALLKLAMRGLDLQGGASYPIDARRARRWTTDGTRPRDAHGRLDIWEYRPVPAFWIAEAAEEEITSWMEARADDSTEGQVSVYAYDLIEDMLRDAAELEDRRESDRQIDAIVVRFQIATYHIGGMYFVGPDAEKRADEYGMARWGRVGGVKITEPWEHDSTLATTRVVSW
jgi:hypothetical protein